MESITALFTEDATASVDQVRASDTAHDLLQSRIHTGELGPGDPLPPERELAAYLGISRTALREALRLLEAEHYIVTRVGAKGGTKVADVPALERLYAAWAEANAARVKELLEVQVVLERAMAAFAAQRRTSEDLARLDATRISPDVAGAELLRRHMEFHSALAKCAHNEVLAEAIARLRRQVFLPIGFISPAQRSGFLDEHQSIFAAIREQDPEAAARAIGRHMRIDDLSDRDWEPAFQAAG
jgi:GntR family transcriptional regulator, transcriptional repressor for pyruvate dehydrogenase complex